MRSYNKLREFLADMEHQQWIYWSKSLAKELLQIKALLKIQKTKGSRGLIDGRLKRWKSNWKPYSKLDEDTKEDDRKWADRIIDSLPFKCPVYQCGGFMESKERKLPKDFVESEHYNGDEQTPDLICSNCKAIYQFVRFKNG